MISDRRDFLKTAALGTGILATGLWACNSKRNTVPWANNYKQKFNMCAYSAPKLPVVRIGFIGLGNRGKGAVIRMAHIDGVEIKALCDKRIAGVSESQKTLSSFGLPKAKEFYGREDSWKELCKMEDIDLIYICTPWSLHTPMSVFAMEKGKHVAVEVPAAKTIDECWQLVETSEKTKRHCMMLENCCYDFFELMTLNMARQGYFGDIVHGEAAYIHTLIGMNFAKPKDDQQVDNGYTDMWRLRENMRNGNLYPTHGLGPICQTMNINRGDQMEYLTSVSTKDFQMADKANELAAQDDFYKEFARKTYRGNMNTTLVRTYKGRSIMIQHDVTSPRPYSRIHLLSGTLGMARKWPSPARIALGHHYLDETEMQEAEEKYTPEIVKRVGEMAKKVGGHGGMDFIMDWRLIDCLRNGLPLDQDVYDAALWSSIAPLSEWSVANRSNSVDVPDFTCGKWKTNLPIALTLKGGGTTEVKSLHKADASKQLNI
ncbi:MAG: Gfo/Idh/MocA family oxidoreductase [Bacteroidales bacterium]|nr:Gfo/Idh/MocA family oxidoreductase [Bacteroidales bacterium]